jgi:hypothetical protein
VRPAGHVVVVNLLEDLVEPELRTPVRVVGLEFAEGADPPAVIAGSCPRVKTDVHRGANDPLAGVDCLEYRAAVGSPPAEVVDASRRRIRVEGRNRARYITGMKVVSYLLALVPVDGVGAARRRAFHQVSEKAVQAGSGVIGSGQTAAAEAGGG